MLIIRDEQLCALEQPGLRAFEDEMVAHGKAFAPIISRVIGDQQLRLAVRKTIAKADEHGFKLRGPIRLCVELMFLCGSEFDTDPQYPGIAEVFASQDTEMRKAERIHFGYIEYLDTVAGPDNINVWRALEAISVYARSSPELSERNLDTELLGHISRAFPQRAAYIGEAALLALIAEGKAEALKHGLSTPRSQALLVILMLAFGHGCTNDLLYPWISQTLTDPKIVNPGARGERLERKALAWLDHVLHVSPERS